MNVPVWCADLAAGFWDAAGDPPPFPRDLRAAATALPFSVVDLPGLSVGAVRGWFARVGIAVPLDEPDRPLRACLVAWLGEGFAFVEADDDAAERRFSLAHELAHFLRDYLHPRETAAARVGAGVRAVLDGRRPPTPDERLHAVLRKAAVRPFAHLLRRDESGRPRSFAEWESESAADRLAFELLAPAAAVLGAPVRREPESAEASATSPMKRAPVRLAARLTTTFGLPPGAAARYAAILNPEPAAANKLLGRLLAAPGVETPG